MKPLLLLSVFVLAMACGKSHYLKKGDNGMSYEAFFDILKPEVNQFIGERIFPGLKVVKTGENLELFRLPSEKFPLSEELVSVNCYVKNIRTWIILEIKDNKVISRLEESKKVDPSEKRKKCISSIEVNTKKTVVYPSKMDFMIEALPELVVSNYVKEKEKKLNLVNSRSKHSLKFMNAYKKKTRFNYGFETFKDKERTVLSHFDIRIPFQSKVKAVHIFYDKKGHVNFRNTIETKISYSEKNVFKYKSLYKEFSKNLGTLFLPYIDKFIKSKLKPGFQKKTDEIYSFYTQDKKRCVFKSKERETLLNTESGDVVTHYKRFFEKDEKLECQEREAINFPFGEMEEVEEKRHYSEIKDFLNFLLSSSLEHCFSKNKFLFYKIRHGINYLERKSIIFDLPGSGTKGLSHITLPRPFDGVIRWSHKGRDKDSHLLGDQSLTQSEEDIEVLKEKVVSIKIMFEDR